MNYEGLSWYRSHVRHWGRPGHETVLNILSDTKRRAVEATYESLAEGEFPVETYQNGTVQEYMRYIVSVKLLSDEKEKEEREKRPRPN